MRFGIVGGGIGGLTSALVMARRGHDVAVFERSSAIREVGAGVQISLNAGCVLRSLGLGDAFDAISVHPERMVFRRWEDDSIIRANDFDEAFADQYGMPLASVARTDLIEILAQAVAAVPTINVSLASRVTHVEPGDDASTISVSVSQVGRQNSFRFWIVLKNPFFVGPCTTANRSSSGASAAQRCSAMHATRCFRSWRRGHVKQSKMPRFSHVVSTTFTPVTAPTAPQPLLRCAGTKPRGKAELRAYKPRRS
ncbi:MAG: hypothetical protein EXQ71_04805 [Acidimicrobiia bacterium]|nr:hypothetical protein [Acidimicrobiia bacterium]